MTTSRYFLLFGTAMVLAMSSAAESEAKLFHRSPARSYYRTTISSPAWQHSAPVRVIRHGYNPEIYRNESGYGES
jgi:hypothetical protein